MANSPALPQGRAGRHSQLNVASCHVVRAALAVKLFRERPYDGCVGGSLTQLTCHVLFMRAARARQGRWVLIECGANCAWPAMLKVMRDPKFNLGK